MTITQFSNPVKEQLGSYVYYLRDPRNKEVFYVGKGKEDRIFSHVKGTTNIDKESEKIEKINDIRNSGNEVEHLILRHGLTDKEASLIEATLIDFIGKENLSNEVLGFKSSEFGAMKADEIQMMYDAKKINIKEKVIIFIINRLFKQDMSEKELYEATRKSWNLNAKRKNKVEYAIASYNGIAREVYKIKGWEREFRRDGNKGWAFTGKIAESNIRNKYIHKSLINYTVKNQNPVRYVNC
jgi:hypothetical protein